MDESQRQLKEMVEKYCADHMEPFMEADDESQTFRKDIYQGFGKLGLAGMNISQAHGGMGMSCMDICLALEAVAKTSVAYGVTLSVSTMIQSIIEKFGTEEQKKHYLPQLVSGQEIGAFALSESGAGSDVKALKTAAKKTRDGYIINGAKAWISSGGIAKTYVVMARTEKGVSSFVIEEGDEGFSYGKKEKKIGWRVSPTRELIFENCRIPDDRLLGREGEGFKIALSALDKGRVTIGAIAVGAAQRVLDESIRYALAREQFGNPIFSYQGLQFMLAEMATEVEASRLLVYDAARRIGEDPGRASRYAAMAKLKATDVCMKVATDAVQIHGGVGCTAEYPVERFMRDAKILQIVEGTNQIQKVVIARHLEKEYGRG